MQHNQVVVIVDMERGFCPADQEHPRWQGYGELPVAGSHQIIPGINLLLSRCYESDVPAIMTADKHPYGTAHFALSGDEPNYQTTWPEHCVDGTLGAEFHHELVIPASARRFDKGMEVLLRGEDDTSYSGMNSIDPATGQTLPQWLAERTIETVNICGVATDHCVRATALDALDAGYDVNIFPDLTRGVADDTTAAAWQEMQEQGARLLDSQEWINSTRKSLDEK